eukprot:1793925-Pyramimonas_sp.AAC.1
MASLAVAPLSGARSQWDRLQREHGNILGTTGTWASVLQTPDEVHAAAWLQQGAVRCAACGV